MNLNTRSGNSFAMVVIAAMNTFQIVAGLAFVATPLSSS
jgi:hypothetical protein